jgi:SP family sugar:H+ symporter-like MFS transporter
MITIGILVSNLINYGVRNIQESDASWRIVIGLGIAFSLPLGFGVLLLPESPRWLAGRHDWDGARMSLARLRGLKDDPHGELVNADVTEMYAILEEQKRAGTGTWMECFRKSSGTTPKVLYRTLLGIAIHFGQQWTGSESPNYQAERGTDIQSITSCTMVPDCSSKPVLKIRSRLNLSSVPSMSA